VHVINGCEIEFTDIVHNKCEYNIDDGNACISKKLDCTYHADVIAHGSWFDSHSNEKMTTILFDVKDVEDKNISTGNFTLPKHEVDYF